MKYLLVMVLGLMASQSNALAYCSCTAGYSNGKTATAYLNYYINKNDYYPHSTSTFTAHKMWKLDPAVIAMGQCMAALKIDQRCDD